MSRMLVRSLFALTAVLTFSGAAKAQGGLIGRVKDKAKEQIDKKKKEEPKADSSKTAAAAAKPQGDASASGADASRAFVNYDFVPGDSVLFFDDFANDRADDLPTHEDVTHGNMTVVDIGGHKYLRTTTGGEVMITLPRALPQRFTVELTFHRQGGNGNGLHMHIGKGRQELVLSCDQGRAAIEGYGPSGSKESGQRVDIKDTDFQTCRYMVDSGYVKAYLDSVRVGQLNNLTIGRGNTIEVDVPNANQNGTLITDIRIAEGGRPLYEALSANGRVSTHGILFATGSDQIRGESTPTLNEIGSMLKAHPDLKLTIEGHTDNVGKAADNLTLSDRRAAAVKQYLVTTLGIDGSRLATKGLGDTKPVAPNTTPEGRQQNRRVDLVKM